MRTVKHNDPIARLVAKKILDSGLSFEEVARRAKVSGACVHHWVNQETRITLTNAVKLWEALGDKLL